MKIETIKELSAISPPRLSSQWKFRDSRSAWFEIERLESEIGIPHGSKIVALGSANARVVELETIIQKIKAATPPPVGLQPPAGTSATPPPAQLPTTTKTIPESVRGQVSRLASQRDRIAGDLPNIKGKIEIECARAKITNLNSKIAKLTK